MTTDNDPVDRVIDNLEKQWQEASSGPSPWDNWAIGQIIGLCGHMNARIKNLAWKVKRLEEEKADLQRQINELSEYHNKEE